MITYLHQYPLGEKIGIQYFHEPMKQDQSNCGCYSDRIYNMHGAGKRFYIATFGYEKGWRGHNTYDRVISRLTLHFVFGGRGTFNGKPIRAGHCFIAQPIKPHTIIQDPDNPLIFSWIALSGTELENQIGMLHLSELPEILPFQSADVVEQIFLDTIYKKHPKADLELLLFSAFYHVLAICGILPNSQAPAVDATRSESYFSEILNDIDVHYAESITVRDIAARVHISEPHLRRICAIHANRSPQELIAQKRLQVAKSMLVNSTASIEEIAMFVGFSSHNAFSKFFSKNCGMSPAAYRTAELDKRRHNAETIAHTEDNWRGDEERRLQMAREEEKQDEQKG